MARLARIVVPHVAHHVTQRGNGLTDRALLAGVHRNWRAMLRNGLEAGDLDAASEAAIDASGRTGRPWGDAAFIARLEAATERTLAKQKPGPKARS